MNMRLLRIGALAGLVSLASTGHSAAPEPSGLNTVYDFYLGGIKAGELVIDAAWEGDRYRAQSVLRTAGVVGFVYKASFEAETEGTRTPSGMVPERFSANSRMKKKKQFVEISYDSAVPAGVRAEPEFSPRPWQVDPTAQIGTLDPITAALSALAPTALGSVCDQSVEIFDGRRRYAIDLGKPETDGDRIRCPATYRRIAGFKPKMMKKQSEFPFHVWFQDRGDGTAHFVRATGDSMFGIAVILLRGLKDN